MQISSIKPGDLVQVDYKGEQLIAEVAQAAHDEENTGRRVIGLSAEPPRGIAKPMRLTATARQVTAHWPRRGRRKTRTITG